MNRPTEVWVGAKLYSVLFDKAKLDGYNGRDRKDRVGYMSQRNLEIIIDDSMAEQMVRETLLHEVLHAVWSDAGLDEMEGLTEEQIISTLTPRFMLVLRANPQMSAYLLYRTPEDAD